MIEENRKYIKLKSQNVAFSTYFVEIRTNLKTISFFIVLGP